MATRGLEEVEVDVSGATREGEPAQGGRERRRRQRRGAEAEKRESTPAAQAARREAGDGSGQRATMAAAWAQRREDGRGDTEAEAVASGQWRTVPSAAPVKSAAGVAAAAVTWWDGGDGDQSAATEWHFIAWGVGWRSTIQRAMSRTEGKEISSGCPKEDGGGCLSRRTR